MLLFDGLFLIYGFSERVRVYSGCLRVLNICGILVLFLFLDREDASREAKGHRHKGKRPCAD